MKSILYLLLILTITVLGSHSATAQGESRMGNGGPYWIFGLNAGGAWQDSDIQSLAGGGWGFYIGHSIFNRPNSFFSADIRFRYMNTYTYGQNHSDQLFGNRVLADTFDFGYRPDTKAFAHNHETSFHDLSLELRLNFEQLRRKHKVWLSVYGGIGLGIYGTRFNQKDFSGQDYDYESIDYTQDQEGICRDLIALQDDTYETFAYENDAFRLTATPTVGIELGYWFTPYFALGIGHRTTFTLQDDFEGVEINNGGALNSAVHHYTSLMLHWRVTGKKEQVPCPEIKFELPTTNSRTYTTSDPNVFIKASVTNVTQDQITYTINNQSSNNFSYDSGDDVFQSNLSLREGENTIVLKSKNACGTDVQAIKVVYTPRAPNEKRPPIVTITNPSNTPITVQQSSINISAQIQYVTGRNNVVFAVNGATNSNFSFSGVNFQANNIALVKGTNTIRVRGINADGEDSKTVIINYVPDEPKLLPIVNITNPGANPYTINIPTVNLTASILNVASRNDVTFTVNGQNASNFSFSGTTFQASGISLNKGSNTLTVTGRNANGTDSESIVVIYQERITPPVVTITNPGQNPFNTNTATASINATISNVANAANVRYTINGQVSNNFNFNGTSFSSNINLVQGANTITITGTNQAGQDSKTTVLIYRPQVVEQPPIVTITYPGTSPYSTQNTSETVQATILNVASRSNVTCTVNGQNYTSFSFSGTSFTLANIELQAGNNIVTITGRNNVGQDTKTTVIVYRPVVVQRPPVVTITAPRLNPYNTQSARETVSATIDNVNNRNDVTCTVNGQVNNSFAFSGNSFTLANLQLQQGNNTVTITGRNSDGQDTKTTVIIYSPAVVTPRPIVTITSPNVNPYTTSVQTVNITATILHVASRNDVTFKVNGMPNGNFSFSGTNFTANNITLRSGNNSISITGRNATGQDTKSTVVIYSKPVQLEPSVVITSPNQNPFTTTNSPINLIAVIKNVATKNDITFTVNGQANVNFSFSGTSFMANSLNLQQGNNSFVITGRNATGQATASTVVIYNPVQPPVVTFTVPNQNPSTVAAATTNIAATISNVATRTGVSLMVNGINNTSFSYANNVLNLNNINLNPGNNSFTITGSNSAGQDTKTTVIIYRPRIAPKPIVTITSPTASPYNTQSASVNLTAQIKNVVGKSNVTFTINGQATQNFTFSGTNFSAGNITLIQGNNTLMITGRNNEGQDTKSTIVIYRPRIAPKPMVTITSPTASPYNTQNASVNITAQIKNVIGKSNVTFTVNGQATQNFTFSGTNFSAGNIALNQGSNTLMITGRNNEGQDTKSAIVIYTKKVVRPIVTITNPSQNPKTVYALSVNIAATILHVASKNDVTFTVNGQVNNNFSFSGTSFVANNVTLTSGSTTFVITGRNSAGQDSKTTVVLYQKPIQKPIVTITNPGQNPFNTPNATINITASILNVAKKADVTFTVNGQVNNNFNLNGNAFVASNLNLNSGNNSITITGRNNAGQDSKTAIIIYNKAISEPVVTITAPNQNPFTTTGVKATINATILNVANASGVTFKVNGQSSTAFSYSGTSFVATNVPLNVGNNTFIITGSNATGTATASTIIIRNQVVPPPTIQFIGPNVNPYNSPIDHISVKAVIQNVASQSGITFKVNGQNANFIYNAGSLVASNITLKTGNNIFSITAQNTAGQAAKTTVVVYTPAVTVYQQPVVTINSPAQNPFTTSIQKATIIAKIMNVASRNNITFKVNGVINNTFSFSGTSFSASNVNLVQGNNTIYIEAKNGPKVATGSMIIIYNPSTNGGSTGGGTTAAAPVINFTNPAVSPWASPTNLANLTATVLNVVGKSNISIKVNGTATTAFVYSNNTVSLPNVVLKTGNNVVTISAVNQGLSSAKTLIITYGAGSGKKAIKKPIITPNGKGKTKLKGGAVEPKVENATEDPKKKGSKIGKKKLEESKPGESKPEGGK